MGLSLLALGFTLIFIGALSFREIIFQETGFKKALGGILGCVFVVLGVLAIVSDVRAAESEYELYVYYTLTEETARIGTTTNLSGCTNSKTWFENEAAWHGKNRYCCIEVGNDVNQCLTNRSDMQKRIDGLMEHTEVWVAPK